MKNVYALGSQLVSIVQDRSKAIKVGKAITTRGELIDITPDAKLVPAKIYAGGVYNDEFVQIALGGLVDAPQYVKNVLVYKGVDASAIVEPQGQGNTKVAAIFAANYLGNDYAIEPPNRIGPGKHKDFDKFDNTDDRAMNGPGGANEEGGKGSDLLNEAEELEDMGSTSEVPETLPISDNSKLEGIKQITIKWDNPQIEGTIDDIKNLFGEGSILPNPTSIVMDTGEEKITSKRNAANVELRNYLNKTARPAKKDAYYGKTPKMESSCGKCGSRMSYNGQTGIVECRVCGNKYKYEGQLPGQGVAGQTDPS